MAKVENEGLAGHSLFTLAVAIAGS